MGLENISLSQLVGQLRTFFVTSFHGRKGNIMLTKSDLNKAVKPNNVIVGDGVCKITVGPTEPADPVDGDLWIDTSSSSQP
jgi:hypothetical protein